MATPANARQGSTWLQTTPVDFNHRITGAERADERISEVRTARRPQSGRWWNARVGLLHEDQRRGKVRDLRSVSGLRHVR